MLVRRMSSRDARANFADLIGQVHQNKEAVIVERNGKAMAVVVSPDYFGKIREEEERAWRTVERLQERNADKDPDEVLRDVTEAVEQVRRERNDKDRREKTPKRRS